LTALNIDNPQAVFGLRPGEALNCAYAFEESGGCGTSRYCSSCGAAIAIVASQHSDAPVERLCAVTTQKDNESVDMVFKVRAQKFVVDDEEFTLLFLNDITGEYQKSGLERTFFHDINNMLCGLLGASEMLSVGIKMKI